MRRVLPFLTCVVSVVLLTGGVASAATCTINGGAAYTNDSNVKVQYDPGLGNTVFRISNSSFFTSLDEWQAIAAPYDVSWTLGGFGLDGVQTVYMQFAVDADGYPTSCQDSITLDTSPPHISTSSVTVKRGRVCYLPILMTDWGSPKCQDVVKITTLGRRVKKTFVDGWKRTDRFWYWRYRCNLPVGRYRIKVDCVDLAGNKADYRHGALLRVR